MDVVLTLVHGTWARKAEWVKPGSEFVLRLTSLLGPEHRVVSVHPLRWSGGNSNFARQRGAKALASHVRQVANEQSNAHHVLIAHSHGGNVALYALREQGIAQSIHSLFCLSVPVFHFRVVSGPATRFRVVERALLFILTILMLGLSRFTGAPIFTIGAVYFGILFALTLTTIGPLKRYCENKVQEWSYREIAVPVAFYRIAGDEASAALAAARLGGWFLTKVNHWRLGFAAFSVTILATFSALIYYTIPRSNLNRFFRNQEQAFLWGPNIDAYVTPALILGIVMLPVPLVILPLILSIALGFGWDSAPVVLAAEISAEESPKGAWTTHQFSFPPSGGSFFEHSNLYQDAEAIESIARTIRSQLENSRPVSNG